MPLKIIPYEEAVCCSNEHLYAFLALKINSNYYSKTLILILNNKIMIFIQHQCHKLFVFAKLV